MRHDTTLFTFTMAVTAAFWSGCGDGGGEAGPATVRLVDRFAAATVSGVENVPHATIEPVEWRFDGDWKGHAVAGLRVSEGRLTGRTTGEGALVHAERTQPIDEDDLLHAVEVAIRVSEGGELAVRFSDEEELNADGIVGDPFPWVLRTPVVPGEEVRRYVLTPARALHLASIRHVVLRPVDVAGATFELESLRIVSRHEHLAGVVSGVGWHGMGDVYREAIVTRAPETVSFSVELPRDPWLDVALGTIEDGAATFRVEARAATGDPLVIERTVSLPHRWNPVALDLGPLSGRQATLTLSVESEQLGFLGFWGTAAVRSGAAASSTRPQGVIVLLADTLRADRLNMLGHDRETAPVLASLAAEGALARDCISQATWTKVSIPAIFTSLYPTTHTVKEFTDRLPASATTMAETFREAGYATLALTSIPFVGQFTNLHQGYEELHESSSLQSSSNSKTIREYMDRLLPWLESHRNVPFFVFLHVADPHSPYEAYAPFDRRWGRPGDRNRLQELTDRVRPHIANPLLQRFGMPTRAEIEKAGVDPDEFTSIELNAYDGSIRAMDLEVGRLLERLRELDLADRILFAFVSDHGTEFLDHDGHFHGQHAYGELNRVPLFLWGPSWVPPGVELRPTIQTIDLMPTVLELVGLRAPEGVQGHSLVPLLRAASRGEEQVWPSPAVTEKAAVESPAVPNAATRYVSLISDGWKLIRHEPPSDGGREYELYDHRADPLNRIDQAAKHPDKVEKLAALLARWEEDAVAARLDDAAAAEKLDPEELERLRSLGYLN